MVDPALAAEQAARRGSGGRPAGAERHLLATADGGAPGRHLGALRPALLWRPETSRWPTAPMTATRSAGPWPNAAPGPTSRPSPVARPGLSAAFSTATGTWSSASSTSSSTSKASPPAATNVPTTTAPASNSPQPESGCGLMSRCPSASKPTNLTISAPPRSNRSLFSPSAATATDAKCPRLLTNP